MQRIFTRDVGTKFKRGDIRSFPRGTWKGIADSAGARLDAFSEECPDGPVIPDSAKPKRGRPKKALAR